MPLVNLAGNSMPRLTEFRKRYHFLPEIMGWRVLSTVFIMAWITLLSYTFPGCGKSGEHGMDDRVLIHVGGSVVTVQAFLDAFNSDTASSADQFSDPETLDDKKLRILNELEEEAVIFERARELNLRVSDEEVMQAVNDFKKDYPDDTFEQTLREDNVSYSDWKKALQQRLLLEKVIRKDLAEGAFQVPPATDKERPGETQSTLKPAAPNRSP